MMTVEMYENSWVVRFRESVFQIKPVCRKPKISQH
jgi:hypothetical protein